MHIDKFTEALEHYQFNLPEGAHSRLESFERLLISANRSCNLLSDNESDQIWTRHFLDALAPIIIGIMNPVGSVLDIGSGGGIPGIPLAIAAPGLDVTMVESNRKKCRFIERVLGELNLANARVCAVRVENFSQEKLFDYCVARAFADIEKCLPLMSDKISGSGKILLYKGPGCAAEVERAEEIRKKLCLAPPKIVELPQIISPGGFSIAVYEND